MKTRLKILGSRLKVVDCLLKFVRDAYQKDPNPEHWRTISGAKVHLTNGKIDGGAGGKFNGRVYIGKKSQLSRAEQETWHKNKNNEVEPVSESDIRSNVEKLRNDFYDKRQKAMNNPTNETYEEFLDVEKKFVSAKVDAAKNGVIFASEISKAYDASDVDKITSTLKTAPENVRIVWNRFEGEMKVLSTTTPKYSAYYSPRNRGIKINLVHDRNPDSNRPAHWVTFHELGHLIDHAAGKYLYMSSSAGIFKDTLKKEVDDYIISVQKKLQSETVAKGMSAKSVKKADAFKCVEKELWNIPRAEVAEVSDIFSGATRNKITEGWKHSTAYWKSDKNNLPAEAFANMFCATVCNPKSLEHIKKYLPKSYAMFENLVNEIAEKGFVK